MKNSTRVASAMIDILFIVDELPKDCPDSILNDCFNTIRSSALACLRRNTAFIDENIKSF